MAISYVSQTTAVVGTTSLTFTYPTVSAGDLLVMYIVNKYPAAPPTTPSGWSLQLSKSGGAGSSGANTGEVLVSVYTKIATGSESGNFTVTITSGNCAVGAIARFSNSTGYWDLASAWLS